MSFRFRRTVRIAPGLRLNVARGGTSLSVGGAGHSVNFSRHGGRATVGLPGSGLSYSTPLRGRRKAGGGLFALILLAIALAALLHH